MIALTNWSDTIIISFIMLFVVEIVVVILLLSFWSMSLAKTMLLCHVHRQLLQQSTDALRIAQIMVIFSSVEHTHSNTNQEQKQILRRKTELRNATQNNKEKSSNTYAFCVRVRFSTSPLRVDPFLFSEWTDA